MRKSNIDSRSAIFDRVLFVTDSLSIGGREQQMTLLAVSLSEKWDRMVWSMHPGAHTETFLKNEIPFRIREARQSPLESLRKCILGFKPDIIHYWGTSIFLATYPMVSMMGIPAINGSIRIGMLPPSIINKIKILLASRLCPYVIANSQAGLRAARVPKGRGYVVWNGIDLTGFPEAPEYNEESPFTAVMCANMLNSKKHELLAETAELAWKKLGTGKLKFLSIGAERDKAILSSVTSLAENALESSVLILCGEDKHPLDKMRVSAMGIHLSNREGLSNSVMEEMACWLPVIASDVGGMKELITPSTGILEHSNRAEVILEGILNLMENKQLRLEMGAKARDRVEKCFSVRQMCKNTEGVYRKAMSGAK